MATMHEAQPGGKIRAMSLVRVLPAAAAEVARHSGLTLPSPAPDDSARPKESDLRRGYLARRGLARRAPREGNAAPKRSRSVARPPDAPLIVAPCGTICRFRVATISPRSPSRKSRSASTSNRSARLSNIPQRDACGQAICSPGSAKTRTRRS